MDNDANSQPADLAIIGGGAAGTLVALHALRTAQRPLQVVVYEPASTLGQGIAYSTPWPEHLLNVPAGRMSALPERPGDFVDYLQAAGLHAQDTRLALEARFVARGHYAGYLQQRLHEAIADSTATLEVRRQTVLGLQRTRHGLRVMLGDGTHAWARQGVLACGNSMRPLPVRGADALPAGLVAEAWDYQEVRRLAGNGELGIIGSGLSMVDSVLALFAAGQQGTVHVFSRHALMPLPHAHGAAATFDPQPLLGMTLRQRLRALRSHAARAQQQGIPWQSVMERIRPLGQALWRSLGAADQRRFLRHVVRYWDVHRHRIAAPVHAQLCTAIAEGRLQLHRVRLQGVVRHEQGVLLAARCGDALRQWPLASLVNATGVENRADALRNPVLRQLLATGAARPGPLGLGLDSEADGDRLLDAAGQIQPDIGVLGSLRIGTLWESLAVPELRHQAAQVARTALAKLDAGLA